MGQENSLPIDDSVPPSTLSIRTIAGVAEYIKSHPARRIVVLAGAGISTSAGIPDFRSPETGLYANLARLNLPFAEAVFDISYFRSNPEPFYALAHELYPGRFRPTVTHAFLRLLVDKGVLLKVFTQNIDTLEREAGVPEELLVEAHGSFAGQRCVDCRAEFEAAEMRRCVEERRVPRCHAEGCGGLVKPDIVFFGEGLPEEFHRNRMLPASADLAIVLGTSLSVQPFASLPGLVGEGVPRVLINQERVGGLGSRADDVLVLGECDEGVRKLAGALGWGGELEELWRGMTPEREEEVETVVEKTKDQELEDEVEKLTREVERVMNVSKEHTEWVKEGLDDDWEDVDEDDGTSPIGKAKETKTKSKAEKHDEREPISETTAPIESTPNPDNELRRPPAESKQPEIVVTTEVYTNGNDTTESAEPNNKSIK